MPTLILEKDGDDPCFTPKSTLRSVGISRLSVILQILVV
jgi:hypothetical protein